MEPELSPEHAQGALGTETGAAAGVDFRCFGNRPRLGAGTLEAGLKPEQELEPEPEQEQEQELLQVLWEPAWN